MGVPRVNWKAALAKVTQARTGEPAARRHDWQWQIMLFAGLALDEYRTAPHLQPPEVSSFTSSPIFGGAQLTQSLRPKKKSPA
jgi:hypothetical protein